MPAGAASLDLLSVVVDTIESFRWSGVRRGHMLSSSAESVRNTLDFVLQIDDPGHYEHLLRIIGPEVLKTGIEYERPAGNGTRAPYRYAVYGKDRTLIICPLPGQAPQG